MKDLIQKLRDADGPSRELDAQIWAIEFELDWWEPEEGDAAVRVYDPNNGLKTVIGFIDPGKERRNFTLLEKGVPEYTASIDAALALVAEVLPEWEWELSLSLDEYYCEITSRAPDKGETMYRGWTNTSPAIAILIALLTALEMEKTNDN